VKLSLELASAKQTTYFLSRFGLQTKNYKCSSAGLYKVLTPDKKHLLKMLDFVNVIKFRFPFVGIPIFMPILRYGE